MHGILHLSHAIYLMPSAAQAIEPIAAALLYGVKLNTTIINTNTAYITNIYGLTHLLASLINSPP